MINLKRAAILGAIASSALILAACDLYKQGEESRNGGGQTQEQTQTQTQGEQPQAVATVTFSGSSVSPATVTIKAGESVILANSSSKQVQVGSDPHPTHTANQELSNGQFTLSIASGASATVTLNKVGTWGYHDHLNPTVKGTVVVQ